MSIKEYNQKRDFKKTSEPSGASKKGPAGKLSFVVQRHDATRLHYDFRLQLDGVLKSWAVPKGPSMNPADKRLAVMVEDHPYEYRKFYGTIPEGNYGAGEVEIWDEGLYYPIDADHQVITQKEALTNLNNGELKLLLAGTHLQGEFVIVRMKKGEDNWLLIKHKDDYAVNKKFNIEKIDAVKKKAAPLKTTTEKKSAAKKAVARKASTKKTGKKASPKKAVAKKATVKKTARKKASASKTAPKKTATTKASGKKATGNTEASAAKAIAGTSKTNINLADIKPMLASTVEQAFDNDEWIFEMKWDGYRCLASVIGNEVELWSRNGLSFNKKFPSVVDDLQKAINHDVVLDGEVIALVNGKSSFQALQHAEETKPELRFCVFDMLFLDGISIIKFPLLDRKLLLEKLLQQNKIKRIQYTDHIVGKGEQYFKQIKKKKLEGIMAKKSDSVYAPGIRTKQWLKIKNRNDREAIIVGYTKPSGSRKYFGALILAEKRAGGYRYIGHTGTGFSEATLQSLYNQMKPLVTKDSPFDEVVKVNAPVTWVKPALVCTVLYTEETETGMLRHPVFAGLRTDKNPAEIVDEHPVEKPASDIPISTTTTSNEVSMQKKTTQSSKRKTASKEAVDDIQNQEAYLEVDKKKVAVTNTSKLYFPEKKITKGDVIVYYNSVADLILPHLKDRPMSLKRNPNGIHGQSFFHKNAGDSAPSWIKTHEVYSESSDRQIEYIICNNKASLIYLANLGCIEMNPWLSTYRKPEHPTYIVIDIDPSEANSFEQVIETAQAVKQVTDTAGLTCFCKTSGASGIHIYIPFAAKYTYDTLKTFGELIATVAHELVPGFTSLERNLKKRGNKIYIDYLQNRRGQTLASAYSLRPVPDASISTPIAWKELKKGLHPSQFTIFNIQKRLSSTGDLFAGVLTEKNDLRKAIKALQA